MEVNITYNGPDVTAPNGDDRTGKIWGQLVPYGMATLGFGNCGDKCPWRAGSNQNTVFTVSHDVKIQGATLAAGSYGLHMIPGEEEWTLIFSNNSTSWGSFFYDETEDGLRVTTKPLEHPYTHWLTYEFTDRQPKQATVALNWEHLSIPWTITVDNITDLYVENLRNELRDTVGFSWMGYNAAALYCLGEETNLEEALTWAQAAVAAPFIGQENFTTLSTLSQLQSANGLEDEASQTLDQAVHHATATPVQTHQVGRQLIGRDRKEEALKIFEINAELNPDTWPVNVGMARGLSALGKYDEAVAYAEAAHNNAPSDFSRSNVENLLKTLKEGKDIN